MQQQWRVRVKGAMRTEIDVQLLVQAVIALGEQLHTEARELARDQTAAKGRAATQPGNSDQEETP